MFDKLNNQDSKQGNPEESQSENLFPPVNPLPSYHHSTRSPQDTITTMASELRTLRNRVNLQEEKIKRLSQGLVEQAKNIQKLNKEAALLQNRHAIGDYSNTKQDKTIWGFPPEPGFLSSNITPTPTKQDKTIWGLPPEPGFLSSNITPTPDLGMCGFPTNLSITSLNSPNNSLNGASSGFNTCQMGVLHQFSKIQQPASLPPPFPIPLSKDATVKSIVVALPPINIDEHIDKLMNFCENYLKVKVNVDKHVLGLADDYRTHVKVYFGDTLVSESADRNSIIAKKSALIGVLIKLNSSEKFLSENKDIIAALPAINRDKHIHELMDFCKNHLKVDLDVMIYRTSDERYSAQVYFRGNLVLENIDQDKEVATESVLMGVLIKLNSDEAFLGENIDIALGTKCVKRIFNSLPSIDTGKPIAALMNFCKYQLGFDIEFKSREIDKSKETDKCKSIDPSKLSGRYTLYEVNLYFRDKSKSVAEFCDKHKTAKEFASEMALKMLHDKIFLAENIDMMFDVERENRKNLDSLEVQPSIDESKETDKWESIEPEPSNKWRDYYILHQVDLYLRNKSKSVAEFCDIHNKSAKESESEVALEILYDEIYKRP